MRTVNYTDFRKNLKRYMDSVIDDSDAVIIPRPGGEGVVLISLRDYDSILETDYVMSSPGMMESIRAGEKDMAEGRTKTFSSVAELRKHIESM